MIPNKKFLTYLCHAMETNATRTGKTANFKTFQVTQDLVDEYRIDVIMDTLKYLEDTLPDDSIKIKWRYTGVTATDVFSFSIRKNMLDALREMIGLRKFSEQLNGARDVLTSALKDCRAEWLKPFYQDRLAAISKSGKTKGIDSDRSLYTLLNAVATNTEPMYQRAFSQKYSEEHTSKILDEKSSAVCSVLKRYDPRLADSDLSDNGVLRFYNILTYNNVMEFKGPLRYCISGTEFSTIGHVSGLIWNTDTINQATITDLPGVSRVMLIENKANFYAAEYRPDTLYLYIHGYASPSERKHYEKMISLLPDQTEYLHWSDMDLGGIRIFRFMQKNVFPSLRPYRMAPEDYLEAIHNGYGYPLTESALRKLDGLDAGTLTPLKECMLLYKQGVEQEYFLMF